LVNSKTTPVCPAAPPPGGAEYVTVIWPFTQSGTPVAVVVGNSGNELDAAESLAALESAPEDADEPDKPAVPLGALAGDELHAARARAARTRTPAPSRPVERTVFTGLIFTG
jgi:hypothetical protein